jgi:hypothetical protein
VRKDNGNTEIRALMEKRNRAPEDTRAQKAQEKPEPTQSSGLRYENLVASLFCGRDKSQPVYADPGATTTGKKR